MSDKTSVTWSAHVRILTQIYPLPDPLTLLEGDVWSKDKWKALCKWGVQTHFERLWRAKTASNYKLTFLNTQVTGLSGHFHPLLHGLNTTQDVTIARPQIKMLCGYYLCQSVLAYERGIDPQCRLCPPIYGSPLPSETLTHILSQCTGTRDPRTRLWPDLLNTVQQFFPQNGILSSITSPHIMTQFILDCTSLNLLNGYRISITHPEAGQVFRVTRQYCYAIHTERVRQLKRLGHLS